MPGSGLGVQRATRSRWRMLSDNLVLFRFRYASSRFFDDQAFLPIATHSPIRNSALLLRSSSSTAASTSFALSRPVSSSFSFAYPSSSSGLFRFHPSSPRGPLGHKEFEGCDPRNPRILCFSVRRWPVPHQKSPVHNFVFSDQS